MDDFDFEGASYTLSRGDQEWSEEVARRRQDNQVKYSLTHKYGLNPKDFTPAKELDSTAAELAVARYLDLPWTSGDDESWKIRGKADVGDNVQVRQTPRMDGRLIMHRDDVGDPPHHYFVLARGVFPTFNLVGWLLGKEGKKERYWTDPNTGRPAFFVPDYKLTLFPERPPGI